MRARIRGDAIRDCTRRGETVLDLFAGSGSTLIAAETCGRQARVLEFDPLYCDTIIARWERYTGKQAQHAETGANFEALATQRGVVPADSPPPVKARSSRRRVKR